MTTKNEVKHTPTPWKLETRKPGQFAIKGDDGTYTVALIETFDPRVEHAEDSANAAFIVRAVNSHEELLAIVKDIYDDENDITRRKHSDEMRFRMEEAIAKAEAK